MTPLHKSVLNAVAKEITTRHSHSGGDWLVEDLLESAAKNYQLTEEEREYIRQELSRRNLK